jgi:hypothetical protein
LALDEKLFKVCEKFSKFFSAGGYSANFFFSNFYTTPIETPIRDTTHYKEKYCTDF